MPLVSGASSPPRMMTSPLRKWSRKSPEKRHSKEATPTTPRIEIGHTPRLNDEDSDSGGKGTPHRPDLEVLRHETTFGGEGSASRGLFDGLKASMCMCPTPAGDLCITDTGNHRLAVVSTRGELRELLGEGKLLLKNIFGWRRVG